MKTRTSMPAVLLPRGQELASVDCTGIQEWRRVVEQLEAAHTSGWAQVCRADDCGSLLLLHGIPVAAALEPAGTGPPCYGDDAYASIVELAHDGARVVVTGLEVGAARAAAALFAAPSYTKQLSNPLMDLEFALELLCGARYSGAIEVAVPDDEREGRAVLLIARGRTVGIYDSQAPTLRTTVEGLLLTILAQPAASLRLFPLATEALAPLATPHVSDRLSTPTRPISGWDDQSAEPAAASPGGGSPADEGTVAPTPEYWVPAPLSVPQAPAHPVARRAVRRAVVSRPVPRLPEVAAPPRAKPVTTLRRSRSVSSPGGAGPDQSRTPAPP